ncbi:MAG: hypothetical protein WKF83_12755 [Nocardioidaceae bacterium]
MLHSVALGMLADPGMLDDLYARVCAHRAGQDLLDLDLSDVAPSDLDPLAPAPSGHPLPATVLYVHHEPDTTERKPGVAGHSTATEPSAPTRPRSWSGTPTSRSNP